MTIVIGVIYSMSIEQDILARLSYVSFYEVFTCTCLHVKLLQLKYLDILLDRRILEKIRTHS